MTAFVDSNRRSRKKLPNIPPEELALHGRTDPETANRHHELPPEVQAQFIKHVHRRSRSLTGLDTMEFERQQQVEAEKENVEPVTHRQNVNLSENKQEVVNEEEIPNFARSLPSTPVTSRKLSENLLKTTEEKEELMKELRWHYKQFVRTSKKKKEKQADASVAAEDNKSVLSLEGITLNIESSPPNSASLIRTNRCDQPKCGKPVEILERVAVENHVFHKSCFVCAICSSWLNHFNYCFVPDHDKFYCTQHYQDIENASFGLGEDIRHAMGIGPGVRQQFKFTPDAVDGTKDSKALNKTQNSIRIMKEKISLLSKRGKKLVKKEKKLRSNLDKFKGSDAEKQALWLEWFSAAQDKNATVRRETELSFKVRELELAEKYSELEKKLRELTEKDENTKTEYDKSKEKELLQEMLEVVEKREQLISDVEDTKKRYVEEDKLLEKERREAGFNDPDLIREVTSASRDAQKVSEAVRQAPSTVAQSDLCCILL
ncbi:unnamed protein product [Porites evermanni]|uniref:LIM zinc-binding domain-containing protein n=1 Tax=Porites evermanni TaxID=104178 RepID=A0ABN8RZB1_9CNID|nr:unnamed protein product [Porites evermanni]